jgi:hypothetical protein
MKKFFNISNHPVERWSKEQLEAAQEITEEVVDLPFPNVNPTASTEEVVKLAQEIASQVSEGSVAMVQGEMTLVHSLVNQLSAKGVTCVAACSERVVTETVTPTGETQKVATFQFRGFRQYA